MTLLLSHLILDPLIRSKLTQFTCSCYRRIVQARIHA